MSHLPCFREICGKFLVLAGRTTSLTPETRPLPPNSGQNVENFSFPLTTGHFCIRIPVTAKTGDIVPRRRNAERGWSVKILRRRGRRHPGAAGRKWPAGPRRYRDRERTSQVRIQVEPRTSFVRPEPKCRLRAFFYAFCLEPTSDLPAKSGKNRQKRSYSHEKQRKDYGKDRLPV